MNPTAESTISLAPLRRGAIHRPSAAARARRAVAGFDPAALSQDEARALLRAGLRVDRPGCWGRAAPAADHWQEVVVYAVLPDATYRYAPRQQRLEPVKPGDLRSRLGLPESAASAPLQLVYVAEFDSLQLAHAEEHGLLPACDAGSIVENVYRHCAGAGLATLVCPGIDRSRAALALGLRPTQHIVLAQAVGRPRQATH